jgi:uncharacterized membrane protein
MPNAYAKAVFVGIIAGMRSMSAPALISDHFSKKHSREFEDSALSFLASPTSAAVLKTLAVGEMAADKTPFVPDRIAPPSLAFRAVSGLICGAAVCTAERKRSDIGAAVGGAAAVASTFAFYYFRREIGSRSGLPDPILGVTEDALVVAMSSAVFKT